MKKKMPEKCGKMRNRLLFKTPGGGGPGGAQAPKLFWDPRGGRGQALFAFFLSVCIKSVQKFSGCAGHLGHFGTPQGPGKNVLRIFFRIFCAFSAFFYTPNQEGRAIIRLAHRPICGHKWTKNPSKYGLKGAQNGQNFVLGPKIMLFYHNFIL